MKKLLSSVLVYFLLAGQPAAFADNLSYGSSYQGSQPSAMNVRTDTDDFNGNLSAADLTVQEALNTIDDLVLSGAPSDVQYLVSASNATLSAEDVVTEGYLIDYSNGAGTGTFAVDFTEANSTDTWGAGGSASIAWTFNLSGTDPVLTAVSGGFDVTGDFDVSSTIEAGSGNITITNATGNLDGTKIANADLGDFTFSSGSATIDANAIALATDTTGNYVADLTAGTAIDVSGGAAENATITVDWDSTEVEATTWGAGGNASNIWTFNLSGTDTNITFGSGLVTFSHDITVTGGDITLGTQSIFSGGDTASLNNIDAIDATTETTLEAAMDTLSNVTTVGALNAGSITSGFGAIDTGADGVSGGTFTTTLLQIDTNTTGVSLDSDGDGMAILAGTGNGNDEDIRFNMDDGIGGANSIEITSGTSATDIDTALNIRLEENASLVLDPAGSADGKYSGITVTATSGYTQAFGDLVYLDPTDSRWEAVDANSAAAADGDGRGIIGMVVSTGTDGNSCKILLRGIIRADAKFPTFTINNPIYASETAAAVTQTQPTTTDVVIRVVGFAITADEMYFDPSGDYITHT